MATNKETSIGIRLVSDLRNYQKNLSEGQKETRKFSQNVKREVGSVSQSFQALMRGDITALPGFFKSSTAAAGGFAKGLHGVKAALIATGIGALLVVLGTAIASITQYFKGTEEGQIVFKKVMNNVKAYVEPVLQMFGRFGKALVQLFKGEFQGAWETAKGAIEGVGDQIKENTKNVGALNEAEEKYIKMQRENLLRNKRLEFEIAEARRIAIDEENYSAAQRSKAIAEAIAKQRELAANKKEELDLETYIAEAKAAQGDNDIETNNQLNELKARQFEITTQMETSLKRMVTRQISINKQLSDEVQLQATINRQIAERAGTQGLTTMTTRTDFTIGKQETPTGELADMGAFMDANTEKANRMNEAMAELTGDANREGIASLSGSFSQLGSAIGGTTGHFMNMAGYILGMIPQLITQIAALTTAQVASSQSISMAKSGEAIASGTASSQSLPFPFNLIALAATIGSIIAALATKPPKMASGGLVYGDSLVNVGEYSNARVNPEVIAPLDKLKGMIGGSNQSGVEILQPRVDFDGEKLYFSLDRIGKRINKRT